MARKVLDNNKGKGSSTLGSKAGNVESTFSTGRSMDCHGAHSSRRASGGNHANSGQSKSRGNSLGELSNVDGRSAKKDGQRYGGSPAKSASSRGPSGIRSKKGKLK